WSRNRRNEPPKEDDNNDVVVAGSGNRGKTRRERLVIDPDGEGAVRAYDEPILVERLDGSPWMPHLNVPGITRRCTRPGMAIGLYRDTNTLAVIPGG
ncbi:MAG: hypothetical protein KAQ78_04695, partial [Candidatus Latescibacteria bacterium]|nr:hypothetical protein [Candidatus Latescibacterota bacterium]